MLKVSDEVRKRLSDAQNDFADENAALAAIEDEDRALQAAIAKAQAKRDALARKSGAHRVKLGEHGVALRAAKEALRCAYRIALAEFINDRISKNDRSRIAAARDLLKRSARDGINAPLGAKSDDDDNDTIADALGPQSQKDDVYVPVNVSRGDSVADWEARLTNLLHEFEAFETDLPLKAA